MKIEIVKQSLCLTVVSDQMFHAVYRGLSIVTHKIISIEIIPSSVKSVKSLLNSIRIQHRNNDNLKIFPNYFSILLLASQIFQYPLNSPTRSSLPRMNSTTDQNNRFLEISFWRIEMFFR